MVQNKESVNKFMYSQLSLSMGTNKRNGETVFLPLSIVGKTGYVHTEE